MCIALEERTCLLYTSGFKGFFAYTDKETLYMARSQMNLADGDLPEEKNEIAVSKEWLSKFFPDCHIGDPVTLDTESFSGEYTISGILDTTGQEKQNMYSFLISKEMLKPVSYTHLNEFYIGGILLWTRENR